MRKELRIILKRLDIEQYEKENGTNNSEVLVMNYDDDDICEDYTDIPDVLKKECGEEQPCHIDIQHHGIQETVFADEVKVDYEELCDVDTKSNVLIKYEQENDDEIDNRQSEENKKSDSADKTKICYLCGFRAAKKHHLQSHIQLAHQRKLKKLPTEFDCEFCMFKTKYKHNLGHHMASFHMDKVQEGGSNQKKSCFDTQGTNIMDHCTLDQDNIYNCKYCSFTTPNKLIFLKHTVIHTVHKSEVLQCPKCPKRFVKTVLPVHMSKVHYPDGVFDCPKCSYTTKWRNNLRRHLKQNKDNETCKPFLKRKSPEELAQARKEGKAPPARKRTKKENYWE